ATAAPSATAPRSRARPACGAARAAPPPGPSARRRRRRPPPRARASSAPRRASTYFWNEKSTSGMSPTLYARLATSDPLAMDFGRSFVGFAHAVDHGLLGHAGDQRDPDGALARELAPAAARGQVGDRVERCHGKARAGRRHLDIDLERARRLLPHAVLDVLEGTLRDQLAQDGRHVALGPDLLVAYAPVGLVVLSQHGAAAAHARVLVGVEGLVPEDVPIGGRIAVEVAHDREAGTHRANLTLAASRPPGRPPRGGGAGRSRAPPFRPRPRTTGWPAAPRR